VPALLALVDCNNFYASCERVFQPELRGKPVVVLSNNDGCIIARFNEAKALGIEMGAPWHLHREHFARDGVIVRSSNYTLYGDMSAWVMRALAAFTPDLEVYSIDDAFLGLSGFEYCLEAHARVMATLLADIAEFERELTVERIRSGIADAKAHGKKLGRQRGQRPKLDRLAQGAGPGLPGLQQPLDRARGGIEQEHRRRHCETR